MINYKYDDGFDSWADVQSSYEMDDSEPDEVLYAAYCQEGYEGWSNVIYRNENSIFWNRGSHCSCYGLEGQWDPEEYSPELFVEAWNRGYWPKDLPASIIERVKELLPNPYQGA